MGEGKWASGRWQVADGKADEFIERWEAWIKATTAGAPGFRSARLLRSEDDTNRFTSISEWDDEATLRAWKQTDGFAEGMGATRGMCDDFLGGDFDVAVAVEP
jgi:heme-degrading monooxygenase HmoA